VIYRLRNYVKKSRMRVWRECVLWRIGRQRDGECKVSDVEDGEEWGNDEDNSEEKNVVNETGVGCK
jgi:hypothetical protein